MASPAVRFYIRVVMALITKLLLVRVAVHAFFLKAHIKALTAAAYIYPVPIADNCISPVVEYLHMLGLHEGLWFYTLPFLFRQLLDHWRINLRVGFLGSFANVAPERECYQTYKDDQSSYDFASVIHQLLPPFQGEVHPAD